jgi:hypothetical protein
MMLPEEELFHPNPLAAILNLPLAEKSRAMHPFTVSARFRFIIESKDKVLDSLMAFQLRNSAGEA